MHSTKSQILAALKRQGRCSVDELAVQLSLAPMTVRQHLATLERDNLVASSEERQRLGRPHFVYFLTDKGEESFPKRYDRIARQLLDEVACLSGDELSGLSPDEKTLVLFEKLADRFVERHRPAIAALPLSARVMAVADLLHAESGFAEWSRMDAGYEIRDYNCCYRRLSGDDGPCRWHERVLGELLGDVCGVTKDDRTPHVCRFIVLDGAALHTNGAVPHEPSTGVTLEDRPDATASRSSSEWPSPAR